PSSGYCMPWNKALPTNAGRRVSTFRPEPGSAPVKPPVSEVEECETMTRKFTLLTGQWADLPFERVAELASGWGYDGLEIAVSGDHLDAYRADDDAYIRDRLNILEKYDLEVFAISNHLKGQAVCDDPIDFRHEAIVGS